MDALLEIKAAYPDEFKGGEEEEKNIDDLDDLEYSVEPDSPTLLIQKDGKTITQLSGNKTKAEIKKELQETLR